MVQTVFCLLGPTGSGKTALAMDIAERLPCSVISVDSAMVYRGLNIGTAKPSPSELQRVPHHLIDIRDPTESYSAGDFCRDVQQHLRVAQAEQRLPLLVGGTLLYFWVLQHGFHELPTADVAVRQTLQQQLTHEGLAALHAELMRKDPETAHRLHPHDSQRILRALEIIQTTDKTPSQIFNEKSREGAPFRFVHLVIAPSSRALLHERLAIRFDAMLAQGFLQEVEGLYQRGDLHADLPAIRTVGYRQAWDYLEGRCALEAMREKAIAATRQLAKRQFTWLRRYEGAQWLDSEDPHRLDVALRVMQQ